MKWLILSDNHGHWATVNKIIEHYRSFVDLIIHCGDSEFPADDPIWENVDVVVSGNMDFDPQYRQSKTVETSIGKVLVVHGHRNGVNSGNQELVQLAKQTGATFVMHGHTHKLYAEQKDGIVLINPGSLNHSRGPINERTYAIMTHEQNKVTVDFYSVNNELLAELSVELTRE